MFVHARATSPVTVHLDRNPRAATPGLVSSLQRLLGLVLAGLVHAPTLAATTVLAAWLVWLAGSGHPLTTAAVTLALVAASVASWRLRPALVRAVAARLVGEAYRVTIYRPRWETACYAAGAVTRVGSTTHVPGLVRHHRTPSGVDVLLVRMAPGQTIASWRDASPSIASTFTAHSVTVRRADRPGWVLLDVLRRDPLADERTAPDPARQRTHSVARPRQTHEVSSLRTARAVAALSGITSVATVPALTIHATTPDPGGIVLGRDEYGHDVTLNPYATAHAGMQGATRSGKSSTCYTLLAALAHRPDVIVGGVDPSGLLLGPFTTNHGGRGADFIATGTSRDDITHAGDVLAGLVTLMDHRIRDLRAAGVDKLTAFSPGTPAAWVVMEEFPGLIAAAKALDAENGAKPGARLAPRITAALGRLVKEGAKVGVFVLVLAQRMSADALNTDDRMNLSLRVTLRVDNADAVAMLHDGATRDRVTAVRDFAPGVAFVESPGHGIRRARFYYTDYPTYRARVAAGIAATAPAPTLRADGTPGIDVVGQVVTLPTHDADPTQQEKAV